jgi:UDP-hydrolysing UDP-N-acetyl-D-glucosamine 2-epimerase
MIKVCILTSTRAEYGLLYWLLKLIDESGFFELQLVVTGTHLSHEHGYTVNEILADGFQPALKVPNLISDDSPLALTYSSSILMQALAEFFNREKPDCFIVLGDRLELLASCDAAITAKIPIVHLHGGEKTEGAIDERVRHAVSKLANFHFTSTDAYRHRVIQMGESPETVVNCGALGLESIARSQLPTIEDLSEAFDCGLSSGYFLVVYHPETNKKSEDISELLSVLEEYPQYMKVIIYPNSDLMSAGIIRDIRRFKQKHSDNVLLIKSTSRNNYLGLMKYCSLYIGNSSSGIIEMPSFYRPIINIGDRQKGRIRSESTLDVNLDHECLKKAIETALSEVFQLKLPAMHNPYQGERPSVLIADKLREILPNLKANKKFMDLQFKL